MTSQHHHAVRPLDAGAIALIVFLCLCWGFNQVAVKLALPDIPPLIQASIRTAGATLMVVPDGVILPAATSKAGSRCDAIE